MIKSDVVDWALSRAVGSVLPEVPRSSLASSKAEVFQSCKQEQNLGVKLGFVLQLLKSLSGQRSESYPGSLVPS